MAFLDLDSVYFGLQQFNNERSVVKHLKEEGLVKTTPVTSKTDCGLRERDRVRFLPVKEGGALLSILDDAGPKSAKKSDLVQNMKGLTVEDLEARIHKTLEVE